MFATTEQIGETENMIKYILNATTAGFDGAIDDARRNIEAIEKSRIYGTIEVFNAIAANPQHGYWGQLAKKVFVKNNDFLPDHVGAHGIPLITTTIEDALITQNAGVAADPDEIDSYRRVMTDKNGNRRGLFSKTPHDELDANGLPSEVSGYYSIINNQLKFTGKYCYVPMIQIPIPATVSGASSDVEPNTVEIFWDTHLPVFAIPTVVKLAIAMNLKEGDSLLPLANMFQQMGERDLVMIKSGAMTVSPVSDVMNVQKEV